MNRSNWFGIQDWNNNFGLEIKSTSSDEAVKLYDAALTQFTYSYDDANFGGLPATIAKLKETDPNFILGLSLATFMQLTDFTKTYFNSEMVKNNVDNLEALAEKRKDEITKREYKYVEVVKKFSKMDLIGAGQILEDILDEYPRDIQALKMSFYTHFCSGSKIKFHNVMKQSHPYFADKYNPFSAFLDGMLGFTFEELAKYKEAEDYAELALAKNPLDGWGAHTLAHVYEMEGRFKEGQDFMTKNVNFWSKANYLACHNYWHLSLFNISNDNMDDAALLLNEQILPRFKCSKSSFNMSDACSFLYRILLRDDNSEYKSLLANFKDIFEIIKPNLNLHVSGFVDAHYLMACLGSGNHSEGRNMITTLKTSDYMKYNEEVANINLQLLESMVLFYDEQYDQAATVLSSIKDSIVKLGGSDAQRDVFNQLMLASAKRSSKFEK